MRKLTWANTLWTGLLLTVFSSTPALAQREDYATYLGTEGGDLCNRQYGIKIKEPVSGQHPVFIYLTGTEEPFDRPTAMKAISKAADMGFVAAAVEYNYWSWESCPVFRNRAKCIFEKSTQRSAIEVLCSRARADCSKGVVVAGFSQGSVLAMLAANFDPRVRAVYGMGAGVSYNGSDVRSCVSSANRKLPDNRLRAINGENDPCFGGWDGAQRGNLTELTKQACNSGNQGCWRDNDSGWFVVPATATNHGADHCYMRAGGCSGSDEPDQKWAEGSYEWSLGTNLRWLKSFTN